MARTSEKLRIAMVGTRGVPARYGGFETCVEEVGRRLAERGHQVVVYCRATGGPEPRTFRGMRLVHLPAVHRRSLETLSHTGLSLLHLLRHRSDVTLVFNAANAPWLPLLRAASLPFATHVDGLEWKRSKWNSLGKRYYRVSEGLAVRWSDAIIADAQGIADYYREEFDAGSELISYGAPIVTPGTDKLAELDLEPGGYHLVVARFEPENNVHLVVEGYTRSAAEKPLIVVGSAPYNEDYIAQVRSRADARVRFLGGVWDQELLNQLYAHCLLYLHGHSVGGTNPSLLRALGAGAPVAAFDVNFNREVVGEAGTFFATTDDVAEAVSAAESSAVSREEQSRASQDRARDYDWDAVADSYEALCRRLHTEGPTRNRPSGRRVTGGAR